MSVSLEGGEQTYCEITLMATRLRCQFEHFVPDKQGALCVHPHWSDSTGTASFSGDLPGWLCCRKGVFKCFDILLNGFLLMKRGRYVFASVDSLIRDTQQKGMHSNIC